MYENLMAIKNITSDTASIYMHIDYHIGHYVKILMKIIFGEDNFRNEIFGGGQMPTTIKHLPTTGIFMTVSSFIQKILKHTSGMGQPLK